MVEQEWRMVLILQLSAKTVVFDNFDSHAARAPSRFKICSFLLQRRQRPSQPGSVFL